MEKHTHTFHYNKPFELESGEYLPGFQLRYTTAGKLNSTRSNVIWICHALTGSDDFISWWGALFTKDSVFNPENYLIICANVLGGCYGSTGPLSINPETQKPFYHTFPRITNRDVIRTFDLLRLELHLDKVHTLIGGSLGGQQVLEWAIEQPAVFENIIPIACNAQHSPWGIAFNEAQRMAIEADASWKTNDERAGLNGLKAARAMAMVSYRNYDTYQQTQAEKNNVLPEVFRAASYQRYQGDKLSKRFNAFTYWTLSHMMDTHHVGRGRGNATEALAKIQARTLLIGIDSDVLFPVREQISLAEKIPNATFEIITSLYGHDGFLVEYDQLKNISKQFLKQTVEI